MANDKDKERAVDQAISQIERQFGRGSIMKMGEEKIQDIPAISTGSIALDLALGIGGVPRGRVVEIYGPESSGKTTLALHIAAETQILGGMVAFIDAEHALDVKYARQLGVDVDGLLVSQPDTGEQDENRCDVWKSGDDHRRERPEILCQPAVGHSPYRRHQGRGSDHRKQDSGQGGQK
jgi:recombination protein RecA